MPSTRVLPFKISVLAFLRNKKGHFLLLRRNKAPNQGLWSPVGGKLEMGLGESPLECGIREIKEETGLLVGFEDLHLWGYVAERAYEGEAHWLLFLLDCKRTLEALPPSCEEGKFAFFERNAIDGLDIPKTDAKLLWPCYDKYHKGFVALRANCHPDEPLEIEVEKSFEFLKQ